MKMQSKNIGQVAEVIAGQSPPSDSYNEIAEGLPFYQGKTDFGNINPIPRKWCTNPKKTAEVNDILISVRAPVGPVNLANEKACIGRGLGAIRAKGQNDFRYIYYFLKNNQDLVSRYSTGSTFKSISKRDIEKIKINIPKDSLDQKRIAQVLTDCENLIAKRKESIALLDELLKSTFLEMFGDPVKNEKGWDWDTLENTVAEDCPLTYGIVQPGEEFSNGVPVVRPVDLKNDFVNLEGLKLIDPLISEKFKRTKLDGGEILLVVRGTTGGVSIAETELKGANVTRGITPIWLSENLNNRFVLHLIKSLPFQNLITEKTYGIALKQINLRDVRVLPIIKPPEDIQKTFTDIADKVEETKKLYQKHLTELKNLYGRLSQDAFKGELDLSDVMLREEFLNKDEQKNSFSKSKIIAETNWNNDDYLEFDSTTILKSEIDYSEDFQTRNEHLIDSEKNFLLNLEETDSYLETLIENNFKTGSFVFNDVKDLLFEDFKIDDYQDKYDNYKEQFFAILKKEKSQVEQYFDTNEGRIKFKLKDEVN